MVTFILNFIIELFIYLGIIYLFGTIIYLIVKLIFKLGINHKVYIVTGIIGTVIHELSHAFMCIVFRHKITEMKLFSPSDDGTLGYVTHTYHKKNIYHKIGNFFIGIAPILGGTLVIYLLLYFLLPDSCLKIINNNTSLYNYIKEGNYLHILKYFWTNVKIIFSSYNSWQLYLFLFISMFICMHMNLSGADVKGSLGGLPYIIIILLLVNGILYVLPFRAYEGFFKISLTLGTWLFAFLSLSLFLCLIELVIFMIIAGIKKLFTR